MTAMAATPRRGNRTPSRALELLLALGLATACSTTAPPAQPAAPAGWLAAAQRHIAEREYRASANREGLQAPNRAQNLRILFSSTGIAVQDRVAGVPLLSLAVSAVGREARLARVAPGNVVSEGSRVEIRRPGLVEWYENSPAGLEQGFTFAQRPTGEGALAIELALFGATASLRGDEPVFTTATGRQLSYGKLAAFDARGRALPSRFELSSPSTVRLSIDDRAATYPVIVDPLLTGTPDAELQSDEPSARLGFSAAGAGDVNGDGFDDVIVGAPYFDAGQTNEGAAFVFLGSASGIASGSAATAATQLESDLAFANLGESVAGAGDVNGDGFDDVIVGDPNYQNGAAFVFHGGTSGVANGNPATAATRLTVDPVEMPTCPGGGNAGFGGSVDGAGDVNGDGFDDVIIGAPRYPPCSSVSGILGIGAAFVFQGSADGIADASSSTAATRIEGTDQQGWLGESVAGAGDVNGDGFADVIVGAPLYSAVESDEGAAFVFLGSALGVVSGTAATASAQLESNQALAHLGSSVASAGDVNGDTYADVIVGAPDYDDGGATFVFLGSASGIAAGNPATAATRFVSDQSNAALGVSVAGVGDVDADGYDDVLAGASKYQVAEVEAGAAFLFLGSAAGVADATAASAAARVEGSQSEERLGAALDGAGDVNGDGYDDVIVGASGHDDGQTDEGAAFIYLPEPGLVLSVATGVALLASLRRRRRA